MMNEMSICLLTISFLLNVPRSDSERVVSRAVSGTSRNFTVPVEGLYYGLLLVD